MQKLWGDNYFDTQTKKWTSKGTSSDGRTLDRAFCLFIMKPIAQVFAACMDEQYEKLWKMLAGLNVILKTDDKELRAKKLLKRKYFSYYTCCTLVYILYRVVYDRYDCRHFCRQRGCFSL